MYQRILVPIDGSATSARGLDEALRLAKLTGAKLKLMHVVDEMSYATGFETYAAYANDLLPQMRANGEKLLQQARAGAAERGVEAETLMKETLAVRLADLVIDEAKAWKADLIVIGTHGRRGASRLFLGSDAEQIARSAPVPVLLVRGAAAG